MSLPCLPVQIFQGSSFRLVKFETPPVVSCPRKEEREERLPTRRLRAALMVVSASALDPSLSNEPTHNIAVPPPKPLPLDEMPAPAVLERLRSVMAREPTRPMGLAIALKPGQVEWDILEELRFTYGFQVCVEAVNALVRHMELSPETIVIFATYPLCRARTPPVP